MGCQPRVSNTMVRFQVSAKEVWGFSDFPQESAGVLLSLRHRLGNGLFNLPGQCPVHGCHGICNSLKDCSWEHGPTLLLSYLL